jgi:hypothetical protein
MFNTLVLMKDLNSRSKRIFVFRALITLSTIFIAFNAYSAGCSSPIESNISGDFSGWDGETVFKLDNGQIWQQENYSYHYHYAYHPSVLIVQKRGCCSLMVDGESESICVKRLK